MTQLSVFCINPDYTIEYSVLPHNICANILPQPLNVGENIPTQLSIFYFHPNYTREYSVLPHNICVNIIPWPSLFRLIISLSPDYPRQYSVLHQYIPSSHRLQYRIFCLAPYYSLKILFLCPRLFLQIFFLSPIINDIFCLISVYSMFTQITLGNILSYHILFLQIIFLLPV